MAVTHLDMTIREPLLGGQPFGATGAYEVLRGTVTFAKAISCQPILTRLYNGLSGAITCAPRKAEVSLHHIPSEFRGNPLAG